MTIKLYVCFLSIVIFFNTIACSPTQNSTKLVSKTAALLCSDEQCVKNVCPSYSRSAIAVDSNSPVCKLVGSCEIPNMPTTLQLTLPAQSHGDIACGPTSTQMALDSFIANSGLVLSAWIDTYSKADTISVTGTSASACLTSDVFCKKILLAADKITGSSWNQNAKPVSFTAIASFFDSRKTETTPNVETFTTSVYPSDINQCDYVSGDHSITNTRPWDNVLLYRNYEQVVNSTSTDSSGVTTTEISFKNAVNGHFITMNGYNTTPTNIIYKFHCPLYGIKWYSLNQIKVNEPFCVASNNAGGCTQFIKVTQLPDDFSSNMPDSAGFTYLVENPGEETAQNYTYKIIAGITGIK